MIKVKINLDKVPEDKIFQGAKGRYLDFIVDAKKETGKYGETHSVYLNQTKEEREAKAPKVYIGDGTEMVFGQKHNTKDDESVF